MPRVERHVHEPLNQEVTAIAGHYVLVREVRERFSGRELLYVLGHAVFDTSCCGMGGCGYALVPGFVLRWHTDRTADGQPVTEVEPVDDPEVQAAITAWIRDRESISQVQFGG